MSHKFRLVAAGFIAACLFQNSLAQSVSISGTVVDSATSQPVVNATITLAEYSQITGFTGSNGSFSLSGPTAASQSTSKHATVPDVVISESKVMVPGVSIGDNIRIDVFQSTGSRIWSARSAVSKPGTLEFPVFFRAGGMYQVKVTINGQVRSFTCAMGSSRAYSNRAYSDQPEQRLAKIRAVYTLVVSKSGYATKRIELTNAISDAGTIRLAAAAASAPVLYPGSRTHSPIDASIVQKIREIAAHGSGLRPNVFMKIGDSQTAASWCLNCFDGHTDNGTMAGLPGATASFCTIKLGGRDSLVSTIEYFRTQPIQGISSFERASLSVMGGTGAWWPVLESPSHLQQEIAAAQPQFAVILYGSNDIQGGIGDGLGYYEGDMRVIVDSLLNRGIIPILTTMPLRNDDPKYVPWVPAYAGVVRAIAQGRQVPLIDLYRELTLLPAPYGMSGDGVHLNGTGECGCWFVDANNDLSAGFNLRNLLTVQALDRVKKVFIDNATPPDPAPARLAGDGSELSPFEIDQVPFSDMRDNRASTHSTFVNYTGQAAQSAPGAEYLYRLTLTKSTALRIAALDNKSHTVCVNLLSGLNAAQCIKSAPHIIATTLSAGTYYIAVDGRTAGGGGEYTLSITECTAGDGSCAQ